ncbi:hypothetical protein [Pantoea sp. 18069]|uniref:hypothetical protein n=1 Tax=Pantoea sp. 18069 TaxID=2681415 RepID=UPI00135B3AA6|nr:hypothetical protein [Pantoea sp. 18069]
MRSLVLIGSFIGGLCLVGSFFVNGAAQQAALAAMACAFAVIPYVGYRVQQLEKAAVQRRDFFNQMENNIEKLIRAQAKQQ